MTEEWEIPPSVIEYVCVREYREQSGNELTLRRGDVVTVLENEDDWWLGRVR